MRIRKELGLAALPALLLAFIIIINANLLAKAENRELARAIFYVA